MNIKCINRLHFIYFFFIWVIITSFIGGISFYESKEIINVISISSAMISIIIGFLAIFISLHQSLTEKDSISKLNDSANRVEKITLKLDQFDFEKIDRIEKDVGKITESVLGPDNNYNNMHLSMNEQKELEVEDYKRIFLRAKLNRIFAYYLYKLDQAEKSDLDLKELITFQKKVLNIPLNNNTYVGVHLQLMNILQRAKGIKFRGKGKEDYEILEIYPNYASAIESEIDAIENEYPDIYDLFNKYKG